jgi:hypothetical protein
MQLGSNLHSSFIRFQLAIITSELFVSLRVIIHSHFIFEGNLIVLPATIEAPLPR